MAVNGNRFVWHYHRRNCETCAKAEAFLSKHDLAAQTVVDARKIRYGREEALALAQQVDEIYASKGSKQVLHFDMRKNKPSDEELSAALLGPIGNLRAPAIRFGSTLIIGFDQATYEKVLK